MAPLEHDPTERSPLLRKPPQDPSSNGSATAVQEQGDIEGVPQDGGAIERYDSADDRARQYEGLPEVKKRMVIMFPALGVGVFLAALDQTVIASAYGSIGSDLDALTKTSWIATAYFLTLTSFQPLYGKLSDIFSRKSCLLFAYAIFGLGCLFCGLARDINELIAARAFAGVGGGGMTTVVSILLSDVIPLKERGTWQGYINIIYATGAATGAPLGGLLADKIGWRWAFLAQAPMCLVAFAAVALVLKMPPKEDQHWKEKLRRVDFIGAITLVAAVFCLLFGLDRGSNEAWLKKITLIPLVLSIPLFALFIFVEFKIAVEPFAPSHIIFDRKLVACYLCNFFAFAGYLAAYFYIPLYFQAVHSYTAWQAGLILVPNVIAGVSGSLFAGIYMQRTGMAVITICSLPSIGSAIGMVIGGTMTGFGNGIGVTSSLIALSEFSLKMNLPNSRLTRHAKVSNCKRDDQAVATACSYLFRALGSTTGVSLSSSVANQTLRTLLRQELSGTDADKIAIRVRQSLHYIEELKPAVRKVVRYCYNLSVDAAFGLEIVLVFGAFISAWLISEKPLGK